MARLRTPLALIVVIASLTMAACTTGSEIPEGFDAAEGDFFRLAIPADWEIIDPPPDPDAFRAEGPESPDAQLPFIATVTPDIGTADVESATDQFLTLLRRNEGFELISNERVEIPGAEPFEDALGNVQPDSTGARMLRYTRSDPESDQTAHLIDVIAVGPEEPPSLLRVGAPRDIWDEELAMKIIDTYELTR